MYTRTVITHCAVLHMLQTATDAAAAVTASASERKIFNLSLEIDFFLLLPKDKFLLIVFLQWVIHRLLTFVVALRRKRGDKLNEAFGSWKRH